MTTDEEPTIRSRLVYRGRIVNLRVDTVRLPGGTVTQREIVEHGETICVVPLDEDGNALLVEQYRKPTGQRLLEVPAGGIDEGETPEEATQRELQEETGYTADRLQHLTTFWLTPGYSTERMHAYLATGLEPASLKPDEDENIRVVPTPLDEVLGLIERNAICDSKSIAVLLLVLKLLEE